MCSRSLELFVSKRTVLPITGRQAVYGVGTKRRIGSFLGSVVWVCSPVAITAGAGMAAWVEVASTARFIFAYPL